MGKIYLKNTEKCMFIIMWGDDHFTGFDTNSLSDNNSVYNNIPRVSTNYSVAQLYSRSNAYYVHRLPCFPQEISDSYSSTWQSQDVLGRSSPLAAYMYTGFRQVSFNLTFHREMVFDNDAYKNIKTMSKSARESKYDHIQEIEDILKALKLACYPLYASNGLVSPTIFFRFGQFTCKGYLESVSYTWKPPIIDNKYMVCDVSIGPIYCSPKSVNEGSASELIRHTSMAPFGNSDDSSESNFEIQGGSTAR